MITIEVRNSKCRINGPQKILNKLRKETAIRVPGAFFAPSYGNGWDGYKYYLTDHRYFYTGLLPKFLKILQSWDLDVELDDMRGGFHEFEIPELVGDFEHRDYQLTAVESILYNSIDDLHFQRGIIGAATNAGKTIIAASLHHSIKNAKSLIIVNRVDLFNQFKKDLPTLVGDDWGYMQGKNFKEGSIMVCMVQTLSNNLKKVNLKPNVILVDECHLAPSKSYQKILTYYHEVAIRVGLSGTALIHKDKNRNETVRAFFGEEVFSISNRELMDLGYSSEVIVKIVQGSILPGVPGDVHEEYKQNIVDDLERYNKLIVRLKFNISRNRIPAMIVCKFHDHVERTYQCVKEAFPDLNVAYVHHKVKDRPRIIEDFREGKIDILISSMIIKEGQNFPLMKLMINYASGDSIIEVLQLLGRATRTHKSKSKTYLEDFFDTGKYLLRRSKHRVIYYKKQKLRVINLIK